MIVELGQGADIAGAAREVRNGAAERAEQLGEPPGDGPPAQHEDPGPGQEPQPGPHGGLRPPAVGAQPGEPVDTAMEREDARQARLRDGIGEEITQVGDGEAAAEGGPVETEVAVDPYRGELQPPQPGCVRHPGRPGIAERRARIGEGTGVRLRCGPRLGEPHGPGTEFTQAGSIGLGERQFHVQTGAARVPVHHGCRARCSVIRSRSHSPSATVIR